MAHPLTGRVLRPQKRAAPAYQILSRIASILKRCRHKPYLRTDLTFVSIDQALYYLVSVILSISLQAIFGIYLGRCVQPIWTNFMLVIRIGESEASSFLTGDVA